jgi:hypothetical protein
MVLAGRGWGKTLTGGEWEAGKARRYPGARIALVAQAFVHGRDTMIEGEAGLLSVLEPHEPRGGHRDRAWNRSLGELVPANGSQFKIFRRRSLDSSAGRSTIPHVRTPKLHLVGRHPVLEYQTSSSRPTASTPDRGLQPIGRQIVGPAGGSVSVTGCGARSRGVLGADPPEQHPVPSAPHRDRGQCATLHTCR